MEPGPPSAFVALGHRNFRRLWLAELVSMCGTMMQSAAILWHISLLAPPGWKALTLGTVGLARLGPILAFGLLSGMVADAVDRRRLLLAAEVIMMLAAALLTLLTAAGWATTVGILLLAGIGAAAAAAAVPARHALLPGLVPREHLPNAVALNGLVQPAAAVAGPALAGIALAATSVATIYALNALSFLAVIGALRGMRGLPPGPPPPPARAISLGALGEGARFVVGHPVLRSMLLLDGLALFFCSAATLLPLFAQDLLQVGPRAYGWLYAAPAVGGVLASAVMIRLAERIRRRGVVLLWAAAVHGLATVGFGVSRSLWLTLLALAVTGAAAAVSGVLRSIVRQMETPDPLRGRVIGISLLVLTGARQLGEFEAGVAAQWLGAGLAVAAGGGASLVATAWIAWRGGRLRAYRRLA